jgi:tRNA threonylcarbamoyladenosine biosynthesis protein TsaE
MSRKWQAKEEAKLEEIGKELLADFKNNRLFTFSGTLGSGKTTFIKYLCTVLGVNEHVSSPTFALVNEYEAGDGIPVFHFDFYRVKNVREAYDLGYEEYFYSGGYCFIEWPEMIEELIPDNAVNLHISVNDGVRIIEVKE